MESSRLTRALKLLNLLQSGHGATVDYLAHSLDCSKRTVFRDIKLLNDNDIRIWFDERLGGYTAEHQIWALVSSLNDEEITFLLVAATLSPIVQIGQYSGIVDQAIAKMMARTSPGVRDRVNRLVRAVVPSREPAKLKTAEFKVFREILQAIVDRCQVRVHWQESRKKDSQQSTKLSPYQITDENDRWAVVGRSTLHRKVVSIALGAIRGIESTKDEYKVPVDYLQAGRTGTPSRRRTKTPLGAIPSPPDE